MATWMLLRLTFCYPCAGILTFERYVAPSSGSRVRGCTVLACTIASRGVPIRIPEDCADLTNIVREEGKYRLEECCVYPALGSATVVRKLWSR